MFSKKCGAYHLMAQVNDGIGNTFQEMGQPEKSLYYSKKRKVSPARIKIPLTLTRTLTNLSVTYSSMDSSRKSMQLALEALKMADLTNDQVLPFMIRVQYCRYLYRL